MYKSLNINDRIYAFECKSTTRNIFKPVYNSGGIKPPYIYIFTNERYNTTLYLGHDIITPEQQIVIDELITQQRELQDEYNQRLRELDTNNRGVSYYTRPMINISSPARVTNYFTHNDRERCEKNVLKFLEGETYE